MDEVSPEVALCIDDGGVWGHTQRGQVGSFVLMLGLGDITLQYYCDINDINDTGYISRFTFKSPPKHFIHARTEQNVM